MSLLHYCITALHYLLLTFSNVWCPMVLTTLRHYLSRCPVVLTESLSLSVCGTAMGHYLSLSNISLTSVCVLWCLLLHCGTMQLLLHYCITALLHYITYYCIAALWSLLLRNYTQATFIWPKRVSSWRIAPRSPPLSLFYLPS